MPEALVLMTVHPKGSGPVVEALRGIPEVAEAGALYGDIDVYAKISVDQLAKLDAIVMEKIQAIPEVNSTKTYIVLKEMSWKR
ncbi:MAG: Lrp/AsnC ligand binding domain-containing protein [Chloroflexi bacterium]|nr:Lrp/AsnC ligand binding domain-containing protein [Chloroflexota bacterium]